VLSDRFCLSDGLWRPRSLDSRHSSNRTRGSIQPSQLTRRVEQLIVLRSSIACIEGVAEPRQGREAPNCGVEVRSGGPHPETPPSIDLQEHGRCPGNRAEARARVRATFTAIPGNTKSIKVHSVPQLQHFPRDFDTLLSFFPATS
jgi:hypothetical protein